MIDVDLALLAEWQRLRGETSAPVERTALLYPVTLLEQGAIAALSKADRRLGSVGLQISAGYHEKVAKDRGIIRLNPHSVACMGDLIIQGPHLGVATPFCKTPRVPCNSNSDWDVLDLAGLTATAIPRTNYARACEPERYDTAKDQWDGKLYTEYYRLAWRRMIPFNTERSLFAALIPPGPAHVDAVHSLALADDRSTVLAAGFWAALPLDYLLRASGRSDLRVADMNIMPAADPGHPLASALLLRTLRLNCLTNAYSDLWAELHDPVWADGEGWVVGWPRLAPLAEVGPAWEWATPLRTEYERRAALVEIDALVSVWLGIEAEELVAIYRSRYPILADREAEMYFDAAGRRLAADSYAFGFGQVKEHYVQLMAHLEDPERVAPPEGYSPPFYQADREAEMRQAHAVFSARLQAAKDAGWTP
ncbi:MULTISPECIES: hypothetical protein [unclassified Frankia]|uniref:hypothetical protein n=1 Tax=unclassified Frankia TaxID=2632575 RepID=UPI002AD52D57|nr:MULTISPECIES: hypothetical protein [unclassified Frankia]